MLSSGRGYDMYGLMLTASTMVPLQGFWNFIVYAQPRYFNRKGMAALSNGFRTAIRKVSRHPTGPPKTRASQPKHDPHGASAVNKTGAESSYTTSISRATEIIPFYAPESPNDDQDKGASSTLESTALYPTDEQQNHDPTTSQNSITNNKLSEDDDAMFEMLLAG